MRKVNPPSAPCIGNEKLYYCFECRQTRWDLLHMHSWVCKSGAQSTVKGFWCQTKRAEMGRARFAVITSAAESAPRHEGREGLGAEEKQRQSLKLDQSAVRFVFCFLKEWGPLVRGWQVLGKKIIMKRLNYPFLRMIASFRLSKYFFSYFFRVDSKWILYVKAEICQICEIPVKGGN